MSRIKPSGELPCLREKDLPTNLNVVCTGFKNTRLTMNVRNLFEDEAPVDLRGGYALRPRTIKLAAEYQF